MNLMLKPTSGRGQTFESLSESLQAAIRGIPPHEKNIPPAIKSTKPASHFTDPAIYEREKEKIFRKFPVVMAPSARIPEPGSVMAHDGYGVPAVITRDRDGKVRAFLNACTHKGAELTTECAAHKSSTLSCPFHAWTFSLDGRLIGVPRQETLLDFDKDSRPLVSLPCAEIGGIIWAILDPKAEADFSGVHHQLALDFESLGLPHAYAYGYRRFSLKANWKGVMEPFLEGYHVQRLHAKSIGPQGANMFADVVGVIDRFGRNLRQTSGRINFTPDLLVERDINIRNYIVHAFNVFPNTVVITSPYYTSVMSFMPQAADHTEVDYHMLVESPPDNPKAEDLYARSFTIIRDVFGNEDFAGSETCQVGLSSGAIKDVIYTGMEVNIPRFYEGVDSALED